jgi:branched-chain amino acid transport system substrate-binding protein
MAAIAKAKTVFWNGPVGFFEKEPYGVGTKAVAEAIRTMDGGPSKYYPGGEMKFDEMGRRVGAGLAIIQWQNGTPVTVYPPQMAMAEPIWPKK